MSEEISAESLSATREAETSEFDLIDEVQELKLKTLQNELIHYMHDDNKKKVIKAEFRKILRETIRNLKYCENIGIDKYIKAPKNTTEIKTFLRDLKTYLQEKGFKNFYIEFHQGVKGENHVQILSNTKDKEKLIKEAIIDKFTRKEVKKETVVKREFKDEKIQKILSNFDKKFNEMIVRTQKISDKYKNLSDYKKTESKDEEHRTIEKIEESINKLKRKYKNGN